jgi:hypothetical protein
MFKQIWFALALLSMVGVSAHAIQPPATDAEVRQAIIEQSIAAYRGNCPVSLQRCTKWHPLRSEERL